MRTTPVRELTLEAFAPYGSFANLIDPSGVRIGEPPVEFYRDAVQQEFGAGGVASFSTCRVEARERVIDVSEYHNAAAEGMLPLDADVLIHVGPATPEGEPPPLDQFEVFRLPHGTMAVIRPGVWHHAPFTCGDGAANVLIVLPERAYANDCEVVELGEGDRIRIED